MRFSDNRSPMAETGQIGDSMVKAIGELESWTEVGNRRSEIR